MTIPYPMTQLSGWVCPKCGRVYAPFVATCHPCNVGVTITYGPTSVGEPPRYGSTSEGK